MTYIPVKGKIIYNHTVEGWRCKQCDIFYAKEELTKGVCSYCRAVTAMNKRNDLSR